VRRIEQLERELKEVMSDEWGVMSSNLTLNS
jgi:hypothetical protein